MNSTEERRGSTGDRLKPGPSYRHPVTFHYEITNHTTRMQKLAKAFKVYRLTMITLICVAAGLVLGLICRSFASGWSERHFMYIEMPGELYVRFLKLLIIPLLVSNVVLAFGSIEGRLSSHLGKIASSLYLASNFSAIALAIVFALLIAPGKWHFSGPQDKLGDPAAAGQLDGSSSSASQQQQQLKGGHPDGYLDSQAYSQEHRESIRRYREYHPMFYHTNKRSSGNEYLVVSYAEQTHSSSCPEKSHNLQLASNGTNDAPSSTRQPEAPVQLRNQTELEWGQHKPEVGLELLKAEASRRQKRSTPASSWQATGQQEASQQVNINTKLPVDAFLDLLRNLVPESIVEATTQQTTTRLFAPKDLIVTKDGNYEPPPSLWPMGHEKVNHANIIGLLAISVLTGVLLSHMEEASKPLLDLCACVAELSLRINVVAINLAPFCIMSLVVGQVSRSQDLSLLAGELIMYFLTVLLAFLFHGIIVLPLAYYLLTRKSPFTFLMGMFEALIASFATSSSSATIALVLNCLTNLDLNPVIVRGFGPLGSVFNMNGTAIYQTIVTMFVAQTLGLNLPLSSILLVGISSAVASLSTSGLPSAGIPSLMIVLNSVNLPVLQLSLIYIIDFIVDRFRTVLNVWSGALLCGIIDHLCPEQLFEDESQTEKYQEMIKYQRKSTLISRRSLAPDDGLAKPQVITVTITPPAETSNI